MNRTKYFDRGYSSFLKSEEDSGSAYSFCVKLANKFTIRIRLSTDKLANRFLPALRHFQCDADTEVDLTVCIWESADPGFSPYMEWGEPFEKLNKMDTSTIFCDPLQCRMMAVDWTRNLGLFWMRSFEKLMWWEDARPIIDILHWWFLAKEHYFIHSAAVGTEFGAALLIGAGGSGKSTTALTCLDQGFFYAGDDFCVVTRNVHGTRVFGTYSSAKLHPWSLDRLPKLKQMESSLPCINDGDDSKRMLFFDSSYADLMVQEMPVKVILLPKVADSEHSSLRPVGHKAVLKAVIPSTQEILKSCDVKDFYGIFALTKNIPAYELLLGRDKMQLTELIADSIKTCEASAHVTV